MVTKKVMVKTYLNQPIIRFFLGCENGDVVVSNEEDGAHGVWVLGASEVFEYDDALYQKMAEFDSILDDEPEQLLLLWSQAHLLEF